MPKDLSKVIQEAPQFNGYEIEVKGAQKAVAGGKVNHYSLASADAEDVSVTLTGLDSRPANLLLNAVYGKDATTKPGKAVFKYNDPQQSLDELSQKNDSQKFVINFAQAENRTVKLKVGNGHGHDTYTASPKEVFGANEFNITAGEVKEILDSAKIYTASILPPKFFYEVKAILDKSPNRFLVDKKARKIPALNEITELKPLLQKVQQNPQAYGFADENAFQYVARLDLYHIGSLVVKTEKLHVLVNDEYKLKQREVGTDTAINLISACGIRPGAKGSDKEDDNYSYVVAVEMFKSILIAASQKPHATIVMPAIGLGVWAANDHQAARGAAEFYWGAFNEALESVDDKGNIENIVVNPDGRDQSSREVFEYIQASENNFGLWAKVKTASGKDILRIADNYKEENPSANVFLVNASDPDVTLGKHVGEYVNNFPHNHTTEENFAACTTSLLCDQEMTRIMEHHERIFGISGNSVKALGAAGLQQQQQQRQQLPLPQLQQQQPQQQRQQQQQDLDGEEVDKIDHVVEDYGYANVSESGDSLPENVLEFPEHSSLLPKAIDRPVVDARAPKRKWFGLREPNKAKILSATITPPFSSDDLARARATEVSKSATQKMARAITAGVDDPELKFYIVGEYKELVMNPDLNIRGSLRTKGEVTSQEIQDAQKGVEVFYNFVAIKNTLMANGIKLITLPGNYHMNVADLQDHNMPYLIDMFLKKKYGKEEFDSKTLKLISPYILIRGEASQSLAYSRDGSSVLVLEKGDISAKPRPFYYNHTVDLTSTPDSPFYVNTDSNRKGPYRKLDKEKLKEAYKNTVLLQLRVAALKDEGCTISEPVENFKSLTPGNVARATKAFHEGVKDALKEFESELKRVNKRDVGPFFIQTSKPINFSGLTQGRIQAYAVKDFDMSTANSFGQTCAQTLNGRALEPMGGVIAKSRIAGYEGVIPQGKKAKFDIPASHTEEIAFAQVPMLLKVISPIANQQLTGRQLGQICQDPSTGKVARRPQPLPRPEARRTKLSQEQDENTGLYNNMQGDVMQEGPYSDRGVYSQNPLYDDVINNNDGNPIAQQWRGGNKQKKQQQPTNPQKQPKKSPHPYEYVLDDLDPNKYTIQQSQYEEDASSLFIHNERTKIKLEVVPEQVIELENISSVEGRKQKFFDVNRANNFRMISDIYNKAEDKVGIFVAIMVKIAVENGLTKDQMLAIFDTAKKKGGVGHKFDKASGAYTKDDSATITALQKKVSKQAQDLAGSCGIFSGGEIDKMPGEHIINCRLHRFPQEARDEFASIANLADEKDKFDRLITAKSNEVKTKLHDTQLSTTTVR